MTNLLFVFSTYFNLDALALVMLALVVFVSTVVAFFSARHLGGDSHQRLFFVRLFLLVCSVSVFVMADHLVVFLAGWAASNFCLVRLMVHKGGWRQARASGLLAAGNFSIGIVALASAFAILYWQTGLLSIRLILWADISSFWLVAALVLLSVAAMSQSAIWPFHKWLLSSLNSPTTVSAVMHAGLVNGGGFLVARFAPLYLQHGVILQFLFVMGLVSAFLGTLWKLMQSDVKRMLAASTMGQMGFMLVQCGLGLAPAAVAHLCWHGLFKAYLFLSSGAAAQEKRYDLQYPPKAGHLLFSLLCGAAGAWAFAIASHKDVAILDTNLFLVGVSGLAVTQFSLTLVASGAWQRLPLALLLAPVAGGLYGLSVHAIESLLAGTVIMQPQPLSAIYVVGFAVLVLVWLSILYRSYLGHPTASAETSSPLAERFTGIYVRSLNASQPHPATVTSHRNHYQF